MLLVVFLATATTLIFGSIFIAIRNLVVRLIKIPTTFTFTDDTDIPEYQEDPLLRYERHDEGNWPGL